MTNKPNKSVLLRDVAYDKIKQNIIEEKYTPGYMISEQQLVNELEMSKTPIKTAINRLEAEGFVLVSSKRGIIVQDLSIERINNIYNLRIILETYNCEQLYSRITPLQLEKLKTNLDETERYVKELNVLKFAECDHEFHRMLSQFVGNDEITSILLNYYDHLYRITLKHLNRDPKRMNIFLDDHKKLYRQLEEKDAESVNTLKKHLEESKRILYE